MNHLPIMSSSAVVVLLALQLVGSGLAWRPATWPQPRSARMPARKAAKMSEAAKDKVYNFDESTVRSLQEELEQEKLSSFDTWFWGSGKADGGAQALVFNGGDTRSVILFDGVCNFCDSSVNFFLDQDRNEDGGSFRFAAQQSLIGRSLLQQAWGQNPEELKSIVLIKPDGWFCKADAVVEIGKELKEPFRTLAVCADFVPRGWVDSMYDFVSSNRGVFGEKSSCRIPDEETISKFL